MNQIPTWFKRWGSKNILQHKILLFKNQKESIKSLELYYKFIKEVFARFDIFAIMNLWGEICNFALRYFASSTGKNNRQTTQKWDYLASFQIIFCIYFLRHQCQIVVFRYWQKIEEEREKNSKNIRAFDLATLLYSTIE